MNSPVVETPTNAPAKVDVDLVVVGAGPAGSAAAFHAARAGLDVALVDMADVPGTGALSAENSPTQSTGRDKTCGDGLTPRAVAALESMGAADLLDDAPHIRGLKPVSYTHLTLPTSDLV